MKKLTVIVVLLAAMAGLAAPASAQIYFGVGGDGFAFGIGAYPYRSWDDPYYDRWSGPYAYRDWDTPYYDGLYDASYYDDEDCILRERRVVRHGRVYVQRYCVR